MKIKQCCRWLWGRFQVYCAFCKSQRLLRLWRWAWGVSCSGRRSQAGGDSLCAAVDTGTVQQLQNTGPISWKPKPKDSMQLGWKKWKEVLLPVFLDEVKLNFGSRETKEKESLEAHFCPRHYIWRCRGILLDVDGFSWGILYNSAVLVRFYWNH